MKKLLKKVDLRKRMPPIFDQGELGSSSACATCYATEWIMMHPPKDKSKLFAYYHVEIIDE
jgi:hypothetical protein